MSGIAAFALVTANVSGIVQTSRQPVVLIRGVDLPQGEGSVVADGLMPPEQDLFR